MSPALLFPLGLGALAAVLLPLLIHLARRTEQRPTDFAALRWLRPKPRPRHRPRFDEWLLLAIRLLLLVLLALLLARPVLLGGADRSPVIAVAPGVDPAAIPPVGRGTRGLWLAPGFPALDTPAPATSAPIGSLIRQLDAEIAAGAPITVMLPAVLAGADAERPRLSRAVRWRIVPGRSPAAASPRPAPRLALRIAPDHARQGRFVTAALAALQWPDLDRGGPDRPLPPRLAALIWLGGGALPEAAARWVAEGGTALVSHDSALPAGPAIPAWRNGEGRTLVEAIAHGRGRLLRFTGPLSPDRMPALAEPDFPRRLGALLAPEPAPTRARADAYRPITGAPAPIDPARDLTGWFALAIAALWALERWLATSRRRAAAP